MQQSAIVEYSHDGYLCEGFAVWGDTGPRRPGILVFPEWTGVGEYTHKRAQMLFFFFFFFFFFLKKKKKKKLLRRRAHCGLDQLCALPNIDTNKLAAIGYCFGGLAVLEMARDGQNKFAGIVSFHGVLATPIPLQPDTYTGKILVLHGVDDPVVPDDQTLGFWKEMRDAKANWEFVAYGRALHTFTNWLMPEDGPPPAVYDKQADRRSWIAMQNFFKEIFTQN